MILLKEDKDYINKDQDFLNFTISKSKSYDDEKFSLYTLKAYISEKEVGYLRIQTVSEKDFEDYYSVFSFISLYKKKKIKLPNNKKIENYSKDDIILILNTLNKDIDLKLDLIQKHSNEYNILKSSIKNINNLDLKELKIVFKNVKKLYEDIYSKEFNEFKQNLIFKSYVDNVFVEKKYRNNNIATLLYEKMSKTLNYNNKILTSSIFQTDDGKKLWLNLEQMLPIFQSGYQEERCINYFPDLMIKFSNEFKDDKKEFKKYNLTEEEFDLIKPLLLMNKKKYNLTFIPNCVIKEKNEFSLKYNINLNNGEIDDFILNFRIKDLESLLKKVNKKDRLLLSDGLKNIGYETPKSFKQKLV